MKLICQCHHRHNDHFLPRLINGMNGGYIASRLLRTRLFPLYIAYSAFSFAYYVHIRLFRIHLFRISLFRTCSPILYLLIPCSPIPCLPNTVTLFSSRLFRICLFRLCWSVPGPGYISLLRLVPLLDSIISYYCIKTSDFASFEQ